MGVSYPTFRDWVDQLESFEVVSGYRDTTYTLTGNHEPLRVRARQTSFTYFGLQGIQPLHGRLYAADDNRCGAARAPCSITNSGRNASAPGPTSSATRCC